MELKTFSEFYTGEEEQVQEGYSKVKKIIDKMVKDNMLLKIDAKALYKDVVDEYEEMGDNPDDASTGDVYEIAQAGGYEMGDEDLD